MEVYRDPLLLKMVHNPGGDWNFGRGGQPNPSVFYKKKPNLKVWPPTFPLSGSISIGSNGSWPSWPWALLFFESMRREGATDMGVEPKIGFFSPKMDGSYWKTLLKLMIWGYPYFWKHPYQDIKHFFWPHVDESSGHNFR